MKKQKNLKNKESIEDKKKEEINFMNTKDRQILYSVVGFLGGILSMNMLLPSDIAYRTFFVIVGGLVVSIVGYKLATE